MFKKILVANRGEIACRIIKTCKKLGIKTVAVFSIADAKALHVQNADEAYLLGKAEASDSYLNRRKILQIAQKAKCEAIHPGYGFLSENHIFAQECTKLNIKFIGPKPKIMQQMSDKVKARKLARSAGLPILPGSFQTIKDDVAMKKATITQFPLMVKASSGGGGIGINIVNTPQELRGVIERARSLASKAFGSKNIYFEKFLKSAAHIEIQVAADEHGNIVHLFERDCSIQRRNQKFIEETPSIKLNHTQQQTLYNLATNFCKYIGYSNLGTIEFLLSENGEFYFIEMNTRLQVEHGITEMITGIDIVELQIRIAHGEKLPFTQKDIKAKGHACELRINAENPETFLPSVGKITNITIPDEDHVRFDSAIYKGYTITPFYDSLIAKLMVWGRDRTACIHRLQSVINRLEISGIISNIPTLENIIHNPVFLSGMYNTSFMNKIFNQDIHEYEFKFPSLPLLDKNNHAEKKQIADLVLHLLLSKQSFENEKKEAPVNKHKHWKESSRNAIFSQIKTSRSKW